MISSLSSFGVYACLRNRTSDAVSWLGAGCVFLSIIPITLIFIRPLNNQLMETEKCISVKGMCLTIVLVIYCPSRRAYAIEEALLLPYL
jgi:Domain of unknown function (DUF1772).